jgi:hypothetical protein
MRGAALGERWPLLGLPWEVDAVNLPAENTISPLEIADARAAAHKASELQRSVEDGIRDASRKLAEAERQYRLALAKEILRLKAQDGVAWTACEHIARGESNVADLRYARDVAKGILEAAQQQAFRYGADRRDLHRLIEWSERRDLRTDAPPEQWPRPEGSGVPAGVDPRTGGLRSAA